MRCSEHAPRSRPLLPTTFAPGHLSAVPAPIARVAELFSLGHSERAPVRTKILPILLSIGLFGIVTSMLLLPARRSGEIHILPGNGWTHAANAPMQWTNNGSFGPGSNWIRSEYGRRNAWLVHDQAVGGTRTFARIDPLSLGLYIFASGAPSAVAFVLARYVLRKRTNVA